MGFHWNSLIMALCLKVSFLFLVYHYTWWSSGLLHCENLKSYMVYHCCRPENSLLLYILKFFIHAYWTTMVIEWLKEVGWHFSLSYPNSGKNYAYMRYAYLEYAVHSYLKHRNYIWLQQEFKELFLWFLSNTVSFYCNLLSFFTYMRYSIPNNEIDNITYPARTRNKAVIQHFWCHHAHFQQFSPEH